MTVDLPWSQDAALRSRNRAHSLKAGKVSHINPISIANWSWSMSHNQPSFAVPACTFRFRCAIHWRGVLNGSHQLGNYNLKWRKREPVETERLFVARVAGEEQARLPVVEVKNCGLLLGREVEHHEAGLPHACIVTQKGKILHAMLMQGMVVSGDQCRCCSA